MSRPELGAVAVGDEVFVREGGHRGSARPATIAKVGRVWLTLKSTESGREWRMRRDRQTTGSGVGYETSFCTPDQLAYDRQASAASAFLQGQGISVNFGSPWWDSDGRIALADLIRKATTATGSNGEHRGQ